jgi:hypothetical protein
MTVVVLLGLFYFLPFDESLDASLIAILLVSLVLFCGLMFLHVRSILRSPWPGLRAVEGLAISIPLLILGFATVYFLMSDANELTFTEPLTRTDALYFALTVFSSVGFGDITAATQPSRLVVSVQIAVNLVVLGLGLQIITGVVRRGRDLRGTSPGREQDRTHSAGSD